MTIYRRAFFLCLAARAVFGDVTGGDPVATDPVLADIQAKAKILDGRLKQHGTTLHASLKTFYHDAVGCFQFHPRQQRGYPQSFDRCLDAVAAEFAIRFTKPVPDRGAPLALRLKKLDAALKQISQGTYSVIDLALPMVTQDVACLAQHPENAEALRGCLTEAAHVNLEEIIATLGEPGNGGIYDLAVVVRETPRFSYVARFNDLGGYYKMPHAPGLPPGQYRNPGLPPPLFPRPDYSTMIRNGFIGAMLFGKPAFGDYRRP